MKSQILLSNFLRSPGIVKMPDVVDLLVMSGDVDISSCSDSSGSSSYVEGTNVDGAVFRAVHFQ